MSIIDASHRRQLRELAQATKALMNEVGPLVSEETAARVWLALQAPAVAAIEVLDQTLIPFNEAELAAEIAAKRESGGEPRSDARPPEIAPDAHLEREYEERYEVQE